MKPGRAVAAGIVGCGAVLLVVWFAGEVTGVDGDLVALSSAAVFGRVTTVSWLAGLIVQLAVGIVAAIVYATIFEWVTRRGGPLIGSIIGIPHAMVAGLVVGFLPGARLIDAGIAPPGAFLEYRGAWCIAAFIAAHIAFGWIAGAVYGSSRNRVATSGRVWREIPPP
jgi:hypothetical protein